MPHREPRILVASRWRLFSFFLFSPSLVALSCHEARCLLAIFSGPLCAPLTVRQEEVQLGKRGAEAGPGEGIGEEEEEAAVAAVHKRPRLTAQLVADKLEPLMGPPFRALSQIHSPGQWAAKLLKLYEAWADTVFPSIPFDTFLKRLEKMSSQQLMKDALWALARKRATMEEMEALAAEEEEIAAASSAAPALVEELGDDIDRLVEDHMAAEAEAQLEAEAIAAAQEAEEAAASSSNRNTQQPTLRPDNDEDEVILDWDE